MTLETIKKIYPIDRCSIKSIKHMVDVITEEDVVTYYEDSFNLFSAAYVFLNTAKKSVKELSLIYDINYGSLQQRRGRPVFDLYTEHILRHKDLYPKEYMVLQKYDTQLKLMMWVLREYCLLTKQTLKTITIVDMSRTMLILLIKRYRIEHKR